VFFKPNQQEEFERISHAIKSSRFAPKELQLKFDKVAHFPFFFSYYPWSVLIFQLISSFSLAIFIVISVFFLKQTFLSSPEKIKKKESIASVVYPQKGQRENPLENLKGASEGMGLSEASLWRFTLKTVTPLEMRSSILKLLEQNLHLSEDKIFIQEVPGGIEMSLIVNTGDVILLRNALLELAPAVSPIIFSGKKQKIPFLEKLTEKDAVENLSWYKIKSKKRLPAGTSAVIIWISQPQ
jgi:hypothetical protein